MVIETLEQVREHIHAKAVRFERVAGSDRDAVLAKIEAHCPDYPDGLAEMVRLWVPSKHKPSGNVRVYVRCACCAGRGHGDTWRFVGSVYNGNACSQCMYESQKAKQAKTSDQYDREIAHLPVTRLGEYVNNCTKTLHSCDGCGHEWGAYPCHIRNGSGCPRCAGYGFQMDRPAILYVVRVRHKKTNTVSIKFGITGDTVEKRYSTGKRKRYILEEILWVSDEHPGDIVLAAERQIISDLKAQGVQFHEKTREMLKPGFCRETAEAVFKKHDILKDFTFKENEYVQPTST